MVPNNGKQKNYLLKRFRYNFPQIKKFHTPSGATHTNPLPPAPPGSIHCRRPSFLYFWHHPSTHTVASGSPQCGFHSRVVPIPIFVHNLNQIPKLLHKPINTQNLQHQIIRFVAQSRIITLQNPIKKPIGYVGARFELPQNLSKTQSLLRKMRFVWFVN